MKRYQTNTVTPGKYNSMIHAYFDLEDIVYDTLVGLDASNAALDKNQEMFQKLIDKMVAFAPDEH